MTNEHQRFLAALSQYDEGDLGGIIEAAKHNGFLDKAVDFATEVYNEVFVPKETETKDTTKKEEKAPTPWLLYGAVGVGLVGAGALVWYLWPKKKGGGV